MRTISVVRALDHAIARAGKHELDLALHEPEEDHVIPTDKYLQVERKAAQLRSTLQRLELPDYQDPLVADAYLLYYHPSHVALGYALIGDHSRRSRHGRLLREGRTRWHIIDLAAGNLAMQFAVAMSVGDAIEEGQRIDKVRVTNIDPSPVMLTAGYDAWHEFVDAVSGDPELVPLRQACEMVETEWMAKPESLREQMPRSDCWITEMYGIHNNDANRNGIRDELEYLHTNTTPSTVLVACYGERHRRRGQVDDAIAITPFNHPPYNRYIRWIPGGNGPSPDVELPWGAGAHKLRNVVYPREVDEICHRYGVLRHTSHHVRWRIHATAAIFWTVP